MITTQENKLIYMFNQETVLIEPWGKNAIRVRAIKQAAFPEENWALTQPCTHSCTIAQSECYAQLENGKITARISSGGKLTVYNSTGKKLFEEYARNRRDILDPKCSAIEVEAREFRPIPGGDYHLTARFESLDPNEKIFGMGQYQQPYLNLKGADLELAHRNSQASVPFLLSSLGYGLLWNNPAIGRAVFGKNLTSFEAYSTNVLDYWIVAGDSPKEIMESYAAVTGTVPMMPEYGLGFWQCKLRYQTQDELLEVAREYKRRGLPIDVIVVDYFHWFKQGDWSFDPTYWPDPDGMITELHDMGIELMVSVWPTVDKESENYPEMLEKGFLIRCERGVQTAFEFLGNTLHFDATNPAARQYVWSKAKKNYYDKGVHIFWLDEAEPEYNIYDFDNYRYYLGPNLKIGNLYPVKYAQGFYEGMQTAGQKNIVNLLRCAWAGAAILHPALKVCAISLRPVLIWASPVFHGGQRTLAASTEETRTTKHSVNCSSAGSSGGLSAQSCACMAIGSQNSRSSEQRAAVPACPERRMRYGVMASKYTKFVRSILHCAKACENTRAA